MIHLENIKSPKDLKTLSPKELNVLAEEVREFLLDNVSKTGGHLSSNLGVVELTLALHQSFNSPEDKIIWDVGHQGYVHKILTGRQEEFKTLRKLDGMSGFLKASESEHDCFDAGHSSTSISAALGYAKAFRLKDEKRFSIAVIGDGALTGGMAFEAINYAGHVNENIIVVLNDNEMSISDNVGALSRVLNRARTTRFYFHMKLRLKKIFKKIPFIGSPIISILSSLKNSVKKLFINRMLFEEFGFTYIGLVDGHNIRKLQDVFEYVKDIDGPILVHVSTKKGKGYSFAENEPDKYHGVSKFNPEVGITSSNGNLKYQDVIGMKLIELGRKHKDIVAITAAMPSGTGLTNFAKELPNQFIDVGIAEQNAVTMAGGMAKAGIRPYVCVYSTFLQRAYDQIVHDICLQNLNVVFCIDRAGLVGDDGETHHGIFDISYLGHIPNLTILAPKDENELKVMMDYSLTHEGPLAIRYPRGNSININASTTAVEHEVLTDGKDYTLIAVGKMVDTALDVYKLLKEKGVEGKIINPKQIKPIKKALQNEIENDLVYTLEDHILSGGFGVLLETFTEKKIHKISLPDKFIEHGSVNALYERYGLNTETIVSIIEKDIKG